MSLVPLKSLEYCAALIDNPLLSYPFMPTAVDTQSPQSRSSSPRPASPTVSNDPGLPCQWIECTKFFPDAETLYNHLCNDHIGRKSTNNLCLTCKWKDCGATCAKRDHITSHLRVHTPLKPHICEICKKSFKRPQDLKKHEKIHTEEHHAQHKHSKAITVAEPGYVSKPKSLHPENAKPVSRAKSRSTVSDSASEASFGVLPTPSPEMGHPQVHATQDLYNTLPAWEALRQESAAPTTGSKRQHEYVDEFFTDMKKRRLTPSYDHHMIQRLSNLSYLSNMAAVNQAHGAPNGHGGYPHHPMFNPRSVSFDVHTPEELAAVNEFLITLGRDVTTTTRPHHTSSRNAPADYEDHAPHSYFNPAGLNELGLAGMPGIMGGGPGSGTSYPDPSSFAGSGIPAYPSKSIPGMNFSGHHQGSMYPDILAASYTDLQRRGDRQIAPLPTSFNSDSHYHSPQPFISSPLDFESPHSSMSTPSNSTHEFDYVMPSRRPPPIAQMAPIDYTGKSMRNMPQLRSNPEDHRPEPVEPKLNSNVRQRGLPAKLVSSMAPSEPKAKPSSLYPSLIMGDEELKLAPLQTPHRSPSPASTSSTTPSRSSTASPEPIEAAHPTLPGIRSIGAAEHLASCVKQIDIDSESETSDSERSAASEMDWEENDDEEASRREEHAKLIKDLLLLINSDFRRKHGASLKQGVDSESRSVTPVPSSIVSDIAAKVSPATRMLTGPGVPGVPRPSSMEIDA